MNGRPDRRKLIPPHLADSVLLSQLDGELSRSEAENARVHLESCWTCRRRLSLLESSIENFLDQRPPLQSNLSLDGEQRVRQFRERLARHAADSELTFAETLRAHSQSFVSALSAHRAAVLASVIATCVLAVMFTDVLGARVSADTLLAKVQTAENAQRPAAHQVTRRAVRLDRIDHHSEITRTLATFTSIEDPETSDTYLSSSGESAPATTVHRERFDGKSSAGTTVGLLDSQFPPSIAAYFASEHWLPTVTVEAFRELIRNRGLSNSSVKREAGAFVLLYPFAEGHPSGISAAQLRVDASNYTAMGLSVFLGSLENGIEYRFTPTSTSTETRTAEIARLFSPHEPVNSSLTRSLPAREPARVMPLSYTGTKATDQEVRLNAALHQADACMGEEIHVFPMSDGSLVVQGLVDRADRRDVIRKALQTVDQSERAQIFLPQELRSSAQLFNLPYSTPEISQPRLAGRQSAAVSGSQQVPLYEQLFQHFSKPGASKEETEQQINAFSEEAVNLSRESFLHAWALMKLDLEFSAQRSSELSAASVQELERMRQDHRRKIASIARRQSEMLAQAGVVPQGQFATVSIKNQDAETLLHLTREQNELVLALFTVSEATPETGTAVSRLANLLHRIGG